MSVEASVRRSWLQMLQSVLGLAAFMFAPAACAQSQDLPEYRLKVAFIYNFAAFTEWPASVGSTLNLCIVGADPFGSEIDSLNGKKVGERGLAVLRKAATEPLKACQIVFVSTSAMGHLPQLLEQVRGQPVLTLADTPHAVQQGAMLNMSVGQGRITFEANLGAARASRLVLSSKLLRLASEVVQ